MPSIGSGIFPAPPAPGREHGPVHGAAPDPAYDRPGCQAVSSSEALTAARTAWIDELAETYWQLYTERDRVEYRFPEINA
ncbi:hypothetical protein [Streptomyces sp. NPDC001089]